MATGTTVSTVRTRVTRSGGSVAIRDVALSQSAAVVATIPITSLRNTTGLILTATEAAGGFNLAVATDVWLALGEVTDNETEVSVCRATLVLPADYVAGTNLTFQVPCALITTATAVNNGSTLTLAVYTQASGANSSTLVTSGPVTFAAVDTWYTKEFTVNGAALVPGTVLQVKYTTSIVDSEAGAGTMIFKMDATQVLGRING